MAEGWISLHKKILKWEWYADTNVFRLFLHLLLKANYQDKSWQGVMIKRGELVTSRESISLATGLTVQQIRLAETKLKSTNSLGMETTNKFTKYIIVKYEDYQGVDIDENTQTAAKTTNEQQTKNKQTTTTIQGNKIIKEKEVREGAVAPPAASNAEKIIKMPYDFMPLDWKAWLLQEKNWPEEVMTDAWAVFREYWQNGKGRGVKRSDWLATFRTWMRKENYNSGSKQQNMTFEEKRRQNNAKALEEAEKNYVKSS